MLLPEFVDTTVREIDDRLRELKEEATRLQAARTALTGARARRGRPAGPGRRGTRPAPRLTASRRTKSTNRASGRNTRATQALELVQAQPGITIPQLADAMKIQPNYLYRVLPRLASQGQVKRDDQGWRPA